MAKAEADLGQIKSMSGKEQARLGQEKQCQRGATQDNAREANAGLDQDGTGCTQYSRDLS